MNVQKKPHLFEIEIFCIVLKVFNLTFDQFNDSLSNKKFFFLIKKILEANFLNGSVYTQIFYKLQYFTILSRSIFHVVALWGQRFCMHNNLKRMRKISL